MTINVAVPIVRVPCFRAVREIVLIKCPGGEIGRHASFRCWSSQGGGGSSPLLGTISKDANPHNLLILIDFTLAILAQANQQAKMVMGILNWDN